MSKAEDVKKVRVEIRKLKLTNITDSHIRVVLDRFGSVTAAVDCLNAVWHGKAYKP